MGNNGVSTIRSHTLRWNGILDIEMEQVKESVHIYVLVVFFVAMVTERNFSAKCSKPSCDNFT